MEDVGAPSTSRQAGKTARGRSDGHFRHPACVENSWRDVPPAYGPPATIYNRYNRWSQRRIWQRIFEKMAAAGPVPDELSIASSHVKADRPAAGSKRGSSRKRLAVRAAEERAKSMPWPMIAAARRVSGFPCKRRRHPHGGCLAWSRRQTKAAAGRQSLRRGQPAQLAQTKEGQSRRSIHSLTPDALSSGQQGQQMQKSHRTHVLQAQELATHRNPRLPPSENLSISSRTRSHNPLIALNESPT